jgi:hypothetical protein
MLSLEPVVRLLGEPGKGVITGLGHGYSSDGCGSIPRGTTPLGVILRG